MHIIMTASASYYRACLIVLGNGRGAALWNLRVATFTFLADYLLFQVHRRSGELEDCHLLSVLLNNGSLSHTNDRN